MEFNLKRNRALPGEGGGIWEEPSALNSALQEPQSFISSKAGRIMMAVIAVAVALVSFFPLAELFSEPSFWTGTVALIDEKCKVILGLVGSSAGASMALGLVPGDMTTPIANKIADVSGYFTIVLAALYLEKYLLPIFAIASFKFLIPAACILFLLQAALPIAQDVRGRIMVLSGKVAAFALVLLIAIPGGMQIANVIENTHETFNTNSAYETIDAATQEVQEGTLQNLDSGHDADTEEEQQNALLKFLDNAGKQLDNVVHKVGDGAAAVATWASNIINSLIETLVILIVTTCVIPILVFVMLMWFVNILFGMRVNVPAAPKVSKLMGARKRRELQEEAAE